jgi:PAS domain S-box-containing protein
MKQDLMIKNLISNIFLTISDEKVYGEIINVIRTALHSESGVYCYLNKNEDLVNPLLTGAVLEKSKKVKKKTIFPKNLWSKSIYGQLINEKKSIRTNQPLNLPEGRVPILNFLGTPVIYHDKAIGVISVSNKKSGYNENDLERLESIRDYISPILNARLEEEKQKSQLKESEEKYRDLLNNIHEVIFELDENGNITYMSPQVYNITGFKPEEQTGFSLRDLIHPDDLNLALTLFTKLITSGEFQSVDLRRKHKDGHYIHVNSSGKRVKIGDKYKIVGVTRDITERKKAEQKLKESEKNYKDLFDNLEMYLIIIGKDEIFQLVNKKGAEIMGGKPSDFIGKSLYEIFPKNIAEEYAKKHFDIFESGKGITFEHTLNLPAGPRTLYTSEQPVKDINGNITAIQIVSLDITEPKITKQKLKESEVKYKDMINNLDVGFYKGEFKGKLLMHNKTLNEIFGNDPNTDLIGSESTRFFVDPEDNKNYYEQLEKEGSIRNFITHLKKPNGETITVELNSHIVPNEMGEKQVEGTVRDITDKYRLEQKMIKSERKYETLASELEMILDHIPALVFFKDTENNFIRLNKYHADAHNLRKEEMQGVSCFDIYPKEQAQAYWDDDLEVIKNKKPKLNIIEPWDTPEGTRWALTSKIPYFNEKGKITGIIGLASDITELKKAEENIQHQAMLVENVSDAIISTDLEFNIISWNNAAETIYGWKAEEVIGKNIMDTIIIEYPYDNKDDVLKYFSGKGFWKGEVIQSRKDGKKINLLSSVSVFKDSNGDPVGAVAINRDRTEQKKAEQKLKESEEKYRSLVEATSDWIWQVDKEGIYTYSSPRVFNLLGYDPDDIIGKNPFDFMPLEEAKRVGEIFGKYVETEKPFFGLENENIHKDGHHIILETSAIPIFDSNGLLIGYRGIDRDITERKKAEQKLKESEQRYRELFEGITDAVMVFSSEGKFLDCNHITLQMLGYTREEFLRLKPLEMVHPDFHQLMKENQKKLWNGEISIVESAHYSKERRIIPVEINARRIEYKGEYCILAMIRDITERKKTEEKQKEIDKLKSEFIRRTSHELKTPLVSIKGFVDLLLDFHYDKLDKRIISIIFEIKQGCIRLENLINDFLKTSELNSGKIDLKATPNDLVTLIKNCVNELKALAMLREHTVVLDVHEKLMTRFEKDRIQTVVENLLINAIKYTPHSGRIEIKSKIEDYFIVISIKDNGIGFNEEEMGKIFEQFGKVERYGQGLDVQSDGSGLGLYISKKNIELHNGDIWVESEGRNKGSKFSFSLPIIKEETTDNP